MENPYKYVFYRGIKKSSFTIWTSCHSEEHFLSEKNAYAYMYPSSDFIAFSDSDHIPSNILNQTYEHTIKVAIES